MRIGVHLRNVSLDISANFMAISAAIALNKAEASYKIEGVGFGNALGTVAPDLPASGSFDFEALSKIVGLGSKLLTWANTNRSELGFLPLQVAVIRSWDDVVAGSAQSVYFAMGRLRKGDQLREALAAMPIGIVDQVVRDSYKRLTGTDDPNYEPRGTDQERAQHWLEFK